MMARSPQWPAVLLVVVWQCVTPCHTQGVPAGCVPVPGYSPEVYGTPGDINIGVITMGRDYSTTQDCAPTASFPAFIQGSTAVTYAVKTINEDNSLLPNLTLGYFITESCFKPQTALAAVLNYVQPGVCNITSPFPTHDVVGLVGMTTSSSAVSYGNFLNLFHVPMVSSVSSAESLSDKSLFKYFVRVIPSDYYQAKAMISIILHFNWTYISTIYSEGDYGRNGIRAVHSLAAANDICIAYSAEILRGSTTEDFEKVALGLLRKRSSRVLVFFTQVGDGENLLAALKQQGANDYFLMLGSDGMAAGFDTNGREELVYGGLFIAPASTVVQKYREFYSATTIASNPDPWAKLLFAKVMDCSWEPDAPQPCDPNIPIGKTPLFIDSFVVPLTIDAVYALAHATHNYIAQKCPEAFRNKNILRSCIKREEILPFLYAAEFVSTSGEIIRFDKNGDAEGKYEILQAKMTGDGGISNLKIGEWSKLTSSLSFFKDFDWSNGQLAGSATDVPESVCSKPCKVGEFLVQLELLCCWECRKCRKNEIVIRNGSSCEECELLNWPNQEHFLTCDPIDPSFLQWTEPQTLACLILAAVGLAFSFLMVILFTKYRHQRLIKATSRELSMLTLSGVILSYVAALVLLSKPTTISCYVGRFCFNLSFGIAYAPLVAKVTRIHRIFAAAKHGTKPPSFVSTRSQVFLSVLLISIQAILSVVSVLLYPPDVTLSMPLTTEPFVEMLCFLPVEAVTYSLTYNLILMLACSIFAFKTRRLPDNFNESKFIFVCVCTTLFLWLAFIPSYFSAFYASQKIVLLVSVLLFNSAVMLLCLYTPRIYAVMYLDENKQGVVGTTTQAQVANSNTTHVSTSG